MCGPIVLALPAAGQNRFTLVIGRLLYNLGRTLTYAAMGIVGGLAGKALVVAGYQQGLSIGLGVLILLMVFLPSRFASRLFPARLWSIVTVRVKTIWGRLFGRRTLTSLLVIGLLNGFLPCGFVYMALAGAASTGTAFNGMLYMFLFGLGTLPILLALSLAGGMLSTRIRVGINRLIPVAGVLLAALIILRGLSLGIPYVSPRIIHDSQSGQTVDCCHPVEQMPETGSK